MPYGYFGKLLRVNLSTKDIAIETQPEIFYRRYFGGEALIAYYLLKELKPGIDPLGSENLLIFAPGILTGHPFCGSGRNAVGAKSPLTGGFGTSEVGGYWGSELKKTGYDAILVEGCAQIPSYLWIHNEDVEIRDASNLWGKETGDVEEELKNDLDASIRVTQIGPAGEQMVRYACIINDLSHAAGRTGMGAVMGSKKLKAIAVEGEETPPMAKPEKVREKAKKIASNPNTMLTLDMTQQQLHKGGTGSIVTSLSAAGGLPTRNFTQGSFEGAEEISGEKMEETILIGRHTCYACSIQCKRTVKVDTPYSVDPKYGGPEYETLASFGSNCGISDLKAIAKCHEICNANGLDTISTGVAISFAMECYLKGILTKKDTDGRDLSFGNTESLLHILKNIVERKGLGFLLGEGVKRASKKLGKDAEEYAIHVKGQELPMHEPRFKKGLGIGYAVSPTGADHCHNMHDPIFTGWGNYMKEMQTLGVLEPIPLTTLNPEKMRLLAYGTSFRRFTNCAVICYFTPWFYSNTPLLVNDITGWNTSIWELMKIAERAATLARIFNIRENFSVDDDVLPQRISQPFNKGSTAGEQLTSREIDKMKKIYYGIMGWNEEGIPTYGKIIELDIGWAAKYLPSTIST